MKLQKGFTQTRVLFKGYLGGSVLGWNKCSEGKGRGVSFIV